MGRLLYKIALLCSLVLANAPVAFGEDSSVPSQITWLDIFSIHNQQSEDSVSDRYQQLETEIVRQLVKPSYQGASSPDINISQIPDSQIFIHAIESQVDYISLALEAETIAAHHKLEITTITEFDLKIPSFVQLEIATTSLMGPISDSLPRITSVTKKRDYTAANAASREPEKSIPVIYATRASLKPAMNHPQPEIELAKAEQSGDSYVVVSAPLLTPTATPAKNLQESASKIQYIAPFSAALDPVTRIQAQLELAGSRGAEEVHDSSDDDVISAEDAATSFSFEYSKQLLGLFVDGEELPALIAAHDGKEYLLPLVTILTSSGASLDPDAPQTDSSEIKVNTPGGPAVLSEGDLRLVDGQLMITQSALAGKLLIATSFDQSSFALYLALPWSLSQRSEFLAFSAPEPDFAPPAASIRNMRADMYYASDYAGHGMRGEYFFSGNFAGGGWRFRAERQGDNETIPTEYYWAKDWGKAMLLAGSSNYSLHPLLPTVEQTGVQYLYSTTALPTSRSTDITSINGSKRIANGIRDIAGQASPGAVAELRIDGKVETRTRVRLDGSYDFPDVELPTRGYSEVIVHLLDNSTGALLETQDFSRRSGIELLANGQHTVLSAVGQQGNLLDSERNSLGASRAAQWRYGLTEDLTIELGRQQVGNQIGNEAAVSMAFSNHWFGSLAFADGMNRNSLGLDIEGGADKWKLDLAIREISMKEPDNLSTPNEQDFILGLNAIESPEQAVASKQWARSVNFRYQINDNFSVGLLGRDTNTSYEQNNFALPTASWSDRKNLSVSARPNSEGKYRIDSRYSPNPYGSVRYAYENQSHLLDYRHRSRSGREYYASYSTDEENDSQLETGLVSHFENERLGTLQMGLVNGENGVGYSLEWEATFIPGVSSQLRLSKGNRQLTLSDSESDLFLQWQVTFDFAVAQKRIVPADSRSAATQSAALTGNLMLGAEKISPKYDIDRIELLIDGDSYTAKVQGGRYYIEGLQPGLHKVAIDARYLPMELNPLANQSFWVRLEKSAATEVPLGLEVKYSIAGRVRTSNGDNLPYQRLVILGADNQALGEVYTDQFGLYRTNNLAPGTYRVFADRNGNDDAEIEVIVTDSYLFEQNLVISSPNQAPVRDL